jgi:small-conductance mechanosensitive channel
VDFFFSQWSVLSRLLWTVGTLGVGYAVGYLINAVLIRRLTRLAKRTQGTWDDAVIGELRRRIPLWILLVGVWVSLGYWQIPDNWLSLATSILKIVVVASVTFAAAAIAARLITVFGPRSVPGAPVSALSRNIVRMVIFAVGLMVILNALGVNVTPMLAALGVGGLAVALALQEPLSNLFAGLFVTLGRQVRIGDYVRFEPGVEGHVLDFNWNSTRIQSPGGNLIVVPNAKVSQAVVTNYSLPTRDAGVAVDITVDFTNDFTKVELITMDVAREVMREVMGGVPEFEPAVRVTAFTDLGVRFSVGLRAREYPDQGLVRHEFLKRLLKRYQAEGIVLPCYPLVPNPNIVSDK